MPVSLRSSVDTPALPHSLPAPHNHAQPYVLIPDGLIEAHARDPLAIGVYVAVARLMLIRKGPVPLSAADLAAWMGSSDDAVQVAIMRRIAKLEQAGWLIITRTPARKHTLLPTWGPDREGSVRPWDFDQPASGRPAHLRGRRLPLALLDTYLGQLKPQQGRAPALISRYLIQPLLDLADIGVYAIQLRTEIAPTARLTHLGLTRGALPSMRTLLAQAASGTLTTLRGGEAIGVGLTAWGYDQLGLVPPPPSQAEQEYRSLSGSVSGSICGSLESRDPAGDLALSDAEKSTFLAISARNTWDVGIMESINMESPPNMIDHSGGGTQPSPDCEEQEPIPLEGTLSPTRHDSPKRPSSSLDVCDEKHIYLEVLSPQIIASHQALNPERVIFPGEWWELLALQQTHGEQQLLRWQARAARAEQARVRQISPAYYEACAAQTAFETYRPPRRHPAPVVAVEPSTLAEPSSPAPAPPAPVSALDAACDALLIEMGIREREKLTFVPLNLIQQWAHIIDHAGLAARFDDPRAFAHTQLQKGQAPPPHAELDRWAERARKRAAAAPPPPLTDEHVAQIRARHAVLVERVAAIAPTDCTEDERMKLLADLERHMSDDEALRRLHERRAEAEARAQRTPEQICADIIADFQAPMNRQLWPLLERLTLQLEGDVLRLICKQGGDMGVVEAQIVPLIRVALSRTAWQPIVRVGCAAPPPPPEAAPAPPAWIAPAHWAALPGLMRTMLLGATLQEGALCCVSPVLTAQVQTRYSCELAALLAAVQEEADHDRA